MVKRKNIKIKEGMEALSCLDEVPDEAIAARRFIITNFEVLEKSGKSVKALHQFLLARGIDVGTFSYFRDVFNKERRKRKLAAITSFAPRKSETAETAETALPEPSAQVTPMATAVKTKIRKTESMDGTFKINPVDKNDLP